MVSRQDGLSSRWSLARMIFHRGDLSSGWYFSRQDGLSSGVSLIRIVSYKGCFSSGWSFIGVVSHQDGLSLGWSHQSGLSYRQVCVRRDGKSDEVQTGLCTARREER